MSGYIWCECAKARVEAITCNGCARSRAEHKWAMRQPLVVPPCHPLAGEPGVVVSRPLPEKMP